jgi:hypothetical protein
MGGYDCSGCYEDSHWSRPLDISALATPREKALAILSTEVGGLPWYCTTIADTVKGPLSKLVLDHLVDGETLKLRKVSYIVSKKKITNPNTRNRCTFVQLFRKSHRSR